MGDGVIFRASNHFILARPLISGALFEEGRFPSHGAADQVRDRLESRTRAVWCREGERTPWCRHRGFESRCVYQFRHPGFTASAPASPRRLGARRRQMPSSWHHRPARPFRHPATRRNLRCRASFRLTTSFRPTLSRSTPRPSAPPAVAAPRRKDGRDRRPRFPDIARPRRCERRAGAERYARGGRPRPQGHGRRMEVLVERVIDGHRARQARRASRCSPQHRFAKGVHAEMLGRQGDFSSCASTTTCSR